MNFKKAPYGSLTYQITVKGSLGENWSHWFEGMTVESEKGLTYITGPVVDQSALHGMFVRIRDIGLTIISVVILDKENEVNKYFIEPTQASGAALFSRNITGEVVMLNLIRLKDTADYSASPELVAAKPISGRQAFQKYIDHTLPFLKESGGELTFLGSGGKYFIGPDDEQWDIIMLVKQKSLNDFLAFSTNKEYMAGLGHRTAAVLDSRLLPVTEFQNNKITI